MRLEFFYVWTPIHDCICLYISFRPFQVDKLWIDIDQSIPNTFQPLGFISPCAAHLISRSSRDEVAVQVILFRKLQVDSILNVEKGLAQLIKASL